MMGVLKCVTVFTVFDVLYRWLYLDLRINDTFVLFVRSENLFVRIRIYLVRSSRAVFFQRRPFPANVTK